ncbi:MAG: hypothetical protein KDD66_14210 [Bdellovibrionales bacterium]|nr:hypothetical protein [Bdellovibrionales bacterium]
MRFPIDKSAAPVCALLCLLVGAAGGCDGFGENFLTKDIYFGVAPDDVGSSSSSTSSSSSSGSAQEDDDGDNLSNEVETTFDMETRTADTDFDGYGDGLEFAVDSGDPLNASLAPSPLNRVRTVLLEDAVTDSTDSDLDGLGDKFETEHSLDPNSYDTDGDGYGDGIELVANSDPFVATDRPARDAPPASDGIDRNGTPPRDGDDDGLSDELENLNGTSASNDDTDSDGFSDGLEFLMGSDPTTNLSIPNFFVPEPPVVEEPVVETITEEMVS